MTLVKLSPSRNLRLLDGEWNRLFGDFLHNFKELGTAVEASRWLPAADLAETKDAYTVTIEAPGIKKDDIQVSIEENVLTISGERNEEKKEEGKEYHRVERQYGSFSRSFVLSAKIQPEKVKASYKDGLLEVNIPKAEEAKRKTLKVSVS